MNTTNTSSWQDLPKPSVWERVLSIPVALVLIAAAVGLFLTDRELTNHAPEISAVLAAVGAALLVVRIGYNIIDGRRQKAVSMSEVLHRK